MSDITSVITKDHNELREYYAKYNNATNEKEKEELANQFRWELARHSAAEELLVYPAFIKHLGEEGKKMSEEDRAEHQATKDMMYELEGMKVSNGDYASKFQKLVEELEAHMKGEETNDLPKLEAAISKDDSMALAKKFETTKNFVPTRAHPSMGSGGGMFESAAGLAMAPMDKLRDMFEKFPQ